MRILSVFGGSTLNASENMAKMVVCVSWLFRNFTYNDLGVIPLFKRKISATLISGQKLLCFFCFRVSTYHRVKITAQPCWENPGYIRRLRPFAGEKTRDCRYCSHVLCVSDRSRVAATVARQFSSSRCFSTTWRHHHHHQQQQRQRGQDDVLGACCPPRRN